MIKSFESPRLQEAYYVETLPSGFMIILYPKADVYQRGAYLSVGYGSLCTHFVDGDGRIHHHPDGSAHFLEHKLFETSGMNIFDQMGLLGADVNAFTTHDNTCFYFNTTESFDQCLSLLLEIPMLRGYTEEGIESEKRIIMREIEMYLDDADYAAYHQAVSALYPKHPIGRDIAGDKDSLSMMTKQVLDEIMEHFYVPTNMFLLLVGDFKKEDLSYYREMLPSFYHQSRAAAEILPVLDETVPERTIIETAEDVSIPSFTYMMKLPPIEDDYWNYRRFVKYSIILDVLFGESSDFFKKHYDAGHILDCDVTYSFGKGYRFLSMSFEGDHPMVIYESIKETIGKDISTMVKPKEMELIKRQNLGHYLMGFNSIHSIAMTFISFYYQGISMFDYILHVEEITIDDFNELFNGVEILSIVRKEQKE